MGIETAAAIAVIVGAAASTAVAVKGMTDGKPEAPKPPKPPEIKNLLAPPKPPESLPPAAEDTSVADADQKARQRAAQRQRQLQSSRSNASTILTSPLGVSTPPGNVQSAVLGR